MAASELDFDEQEVLQGAFARAAAPLDGRERAAELLAGGGFVAVVAVLALFTEPAGDWNPVAVIACTIGVALATAVRFEVAGIYTVPSQLAFVPLLFAAPAQAVPAFVVVALAASRVPAVLRGEVPPSRLLLSFANAWFTVGPVVVFVAAGGPSSVAAAPALMAAVFAGQVATDFAASALREAIVRGATLREQMADARWVYSVDAALTPVAFLAATLGGDSGWQPLALMPLLALLHTFARERRARLDAAFELTDAYRGMALVLGDVVEADDHYTGEHCKQVVDLALEVGASFDLSAERRRNLEFAALLHDVGKVVIPKEIINKPGRLTSEEYALVKTHAAEGQRMLDRVGGFMRDVGLVVRHHHERWDGGGYPDGLAGRDIPLEARIIACCDTFNAMTTTRSYRAARPVAEALAELRRCAGSQFDAAVVDALHAAVGSGVEAAPAFVANTAAPAGSGEWHGDPAAAPAAAA